MNEGNCWTCGDALHTKHIVIVHPITGTNGAGDPIRGLEKSVHVCGPCLNSSRDHAADKATAGGPGMKAARASSPVATTVDMGAPAKVTGPAPVALFTAKTAAKPVPIVAAPVPIVAAPVRIVAAPVPIVAALK